MKMFFEKVSCKLLLLLLLSFSAGVTLSDHPQLKNLHKQADFSEAVQSCALLPGEWSLPDSYQQTNILKRLMRRDGIQSLWLGIQKLTFTSWRWVDGNILKNTIKDTNITRTCGVLTINGTLYSAKCTDYTAGSICEIPGEKHCPGYACFYHENRVLMVSCQAGSWFSTRQYCRQHGGDLAIFKSAVKIQFMIRKLQGKVCPKSMSFFIGLHREDWVPIFDLQNIINRRNLSDSELRDDRCALIKIDASSNLEMVFQHCTSHAAVICQSYEKYIATDALPTRIDRPSKDGGGSITAVLAVVVSLSVLIALVLAGVVLHVTLKKVLTRRKHTKDEEEEMSLLNNGYDLDSILSDDRINILNKNVSKLMQRIQLKGSELLEMLVQKEVIAKANKEHIEKIEDDRTGVKQLLDMLIKKTNKDYEQFCDALTECGQGSLVQFFLLTEGDLNRAKTQLTTHIDNICDVNFLTATAPELTQEKKKIEAIFTDVTWLHRDNDSSTHMEKEMKFSDIYCQMRNLPNGRIIVTGNAGVGKTTFLKRLLHELTLKNATNQMNLVLPITLRYISEKEDTIYKILKKQIASLSSLNIYAILKALPSKNHIKWILLDGYDEISDKDVINKNILNQEYSNSYIVVTTRQNLVKTIDAHMSGDNHQLFEIKGFSKSQIRKYIEMYFRNKRALGEELHDCFSTERPDLYVMASVPIRLQVMCTVWKVKKSLGEKMVDIYSNFVDSMFEHLHQKGKSFALSEEDSRLCKAALGKLANTWKSISNIEPSFSNKQLKVCLAERYSQISSLGFLTKFGRSDDDSELSWSFSHITFQEYFLAYSIGQAEITSELVSDFADRCRTVRILENMKMVIFFICELNSQCANKILTSVIHKIVDESDCRKLLSILLEICSHYKNKNEVNFPLPYFVEPLDNADPTVFELLLRNDTKENHRNMKNMKLKENAVQSIERHFDPNCFKYVKTIHFFINTKQTITWAANEVKNASSVQVLIIESDTVGLAKEIEKVLANVPSKNITSLTVRTANAMHILSSKLGEFPSLLQLHVAEKSSDVNTTAIFPFCTAASSCKCLETLYITTPDLCESFLALQTSAYVSLNVEELTSTNLVNFVEGFDAKFTEGLKFEKFTIRSKEEAQMKKMGKYFAEILIQLTRLETLDISRCGIYTETIKDMWYHLLQKRSKLHLSGLFLAGNFFRGSGEILGKFVKLMPALKSLNIASSKLSPEDMSLLSNQVLHNENLRDLNVSDNLITGKDFTLGDISTCFPKLETLDISECGITKDQLSTFTSDMRSTSISRLKHLKMNNNSVTDKGLEELIPKIQFFSNLEHLEMASCNLRDVNILKKLLSSLPTSICYLRIENNDFGNKVTEITQGKEKLSRLKVLYIGTAEQSDERITIKHELQKLNPDIDVTY